MQKRTGQGAQIRMGARDGNGGAGMGAGGEGNGNAGGGQSKMPHMSISCNFLYSLMME